MKEKKFCSVEGCKNPVKSRGLCNKHYKRYLKHGDPLLGKKERELHGKSNSPEYKSWDNMKTRCSNPRHESYYLYGGQGIRVCEEWEKSFSAFYKDMGEKPSPEYHIDRIDGKKDYTPENCRWSSPKENARNTTQIKLNMEIADSIRFKYKNGETISNLAKENNISYSAIKSVILNETWT